MDDKTKRLLVAVRDAIQYMNPIAEIDIKGQLVEALGAFEDEKIGEDIKKIQRNNSNLYSYKELGKTVYEAKDSLTTVFDFWFENHS